MQSPSGEPHRSTVPGAEELLHQKDFATVARLIVQAVDDPAADVSVWALAGRPRELGLGQAGEKVAQPLLLCLKLGDDIRKRRPAIRRDLGRPALPTEY